MEHFVKQIQKYGLKKNATERKNMPGTISVYKFMRLTIIGIYPYGNVIV